MIIIIIIHIRHEAKIGRNVREGDRGGRNGKKEESKNTTRNYKRENTLF